MPTRATIQSPTLDVSAERLWRVRTTELFMSCERDVFGDDESALTLYERVMDDPNRARYVVRTRTRMRMPYAARRALGSLADARVETLDEFETDETPSTAPFLYEATLRSYSNHLNAENSRVEGTVRCKSVDGGARAELTLGLSCDVRASMVGAAIERAMIANVRARFAMYPKVLELYETRVREREARARELGGTSRDARDAPAAADESDDDASFHSAEELDASDEEWSDDQESPRCRGTKTEDGHDASRCCVPRARHWRALRI